MSDTNNIYRCPECGEPVAGDSDVCLACGAALSEPDAEKNEYFNGEIYFAFALSGIASVHSLLLKFKIFCFKISSFF